MFIRTMMVFAVLGAKETAPADPALPGPFPVGALTIDFIDSARAGRLLRTEIWYPADQESPGPTTAPRPGNMPAVASRAVRDARVAPGRFPWIVFSHGLLAIREQSTFLTEHLASHGYIVIAPDHQHNTARDFKPKEVFQSGIDRPKDVSLLMDRMLAKSRDPDDPFHQRLEEADVAVMGHSYGGYTALAVGGAGVNGVEVARRMRQPQAAREYDFTDPRPKAVVAYAPVGPPVFTARGLERLRKPTLVFAGTFDEVTPLEQHQRPIFEHLGGPSILATIEGGTHYSFNNAELSRLVQIFIKNKPTITRADSDRIVLRVTLAFLDRYLLGSKRWQEYLEAEEPGLILEERNLGVQAAAAGSDR